MVPSRQFRADIAGLVAVLAALMPFQRLSAQFNDNQIFDGMSTNTLFAVPPNTVPYWSVDGTCSPGLIFNDGNKGDNGSTCLQNLLPMGVGTRMVRDLNPGPGDSTVGTAAMAAFGAGVYKRLFLAADNGSGSKLYRIVETLYPVLMEERDNSPTPVAILGPEGLTPHDGRGANIFFSADDGVGGRELWWSYTSTCVEPPCLGIPTPTIPQPVSLTVTNARILDINSGAGDSNPSGFAAASTAAGNMVVFAADDGATGRELWKVNDATEPAAPSAALLKDLNVGAASSDPQLLTTVAFAGTADMKAFFTADDGVNGRELWRTDGTPTGTGIVKDIVAGVAGSNPTNLKPVTLLPAGIATPSLMFTVDSGGVAGQELWKSRGALDGADTVLVFDPGAAGSPANLTSLNGIYTLFFTLGNQLWKSDGTTAGTTLVRTFTAPPHDLVASGNVLFFAADDGMSGVELWKAYNDTSVPPVVVATMAKDINPGPAGSSPANIFAVGGVVYCSADDGAHGRELWRSDTAAGAVMVTDINPGAPGSDPVPKANLDGTLILVANDGTHGRELWQSDGNAVPDHVGMSYKYDLGALIAAKTGGAKHWAMGTDAAPIKTYWLLDMPFQGAATPGVSESAHQENLYVELAEGGDRAPLGITYVDCGDGNVLRPQAALTDGMVHRAVAFGMVAVLDQNPCDTDARAPGSPGVPVAYAPAVYDGRDWVLLKVGTLPEGIPAGVPTSPPSGAAFGQKNSASNAEIGEIRGGLFPSGLSPATDDAWSTRRFTHCRLDISDEYITVFLALKQGNRTWVATVPRHYKGAFDALYVGNEACIQSAWQFWFDTLTLSGGLFTDAATRYGACCFSTQCVDVASVDDCPPGRAYSDLLRCNDPAMPMCCPYPWADADADGDVDMEDFAVFQSCYTGSSAPAPGLCECLDYNGDHQIGSTDVGEFAKCATGASIPFFPNPPAGCVY